MPRGPKGEKRPADVIGNAVHVMRIATGEIEETALLVRRLALPAASAHHDSAATDGAHRRMS